jgi:hypothetical protein
MVGIIGSNWVAGKFGIVVSNGNISDTVRLGGIAGISLFTVPGLLAAPVSGALLAQQWETIFNLGKAAAPAIAATSLAAFAYKAYDRSRRNLDWKRYATAGALTLAIVPFTLIFMHPTNQSLLLVAGGGATAAAVNDDSVRALITKWAGLNLIRSLLPLGGAVIGLWALAEEKLGTAEAGSKQAGGKDVTKSHPASYSKADGGADVSKTHPASY